MYADAEAQRPLLLLYLLFDASGSTVRHGFNIGCNQAFPELIAAVEERGSDSVRICLISYGTDARVHIPLARAADVAMLPLLPATGLGSLVAGFDLLADAIVRDCAQLAADDLVVGPIVALLVTDDLPTDSGARVLAARAALDIASPTPVALHIAAPASLDLLTLAGLRGRVHQLAAGGSAAVAEGIVTAARTILSSLYD